MSVNSKKTPMHVIKTVASVAAKFRPAAIAVAGALTLSGCVAPEVVCTESGNCYEVAPPAAEFDGPVFSPFLFGGGYGGDYSRPHRHEGYGWGGYGGRGAEERGYEGRPGGGRHGGPLLRFGR